MFKTLFFPLKMSFCIQIIHTNHQMNKPYWVPITNSCNQRKALLWSSLGIGMLLIFQCCTVHVMYSSPLFQIITAYPDLLKCKKNTQTQRHSFCCFYFIFQNYSTGDRRQCKTKINRREIIYSTGRQVKKNKQKKC